MNSSAALWSRLAREPRSVQLVRGCAAVMIGLGLHLRVRSFAFPQFFLFDEHHFVVNARNYLLHRADQNDHPPLGKLIIAASIDAFGDGPVGWRAPALAFGALSIVAGAMVAARFFRGASNIANAYALNIANAPAFDAGVLTAGLLCADGFMIAYSRAGLLDGYLAACALTALFIATYNPTLVTALLGGLLLGVATNIKFSGICVLPPLLLSIALGGTRLAQRALHAAIVVGAGVCVYVALYAYGWSFAHDDVSLGDVFRDTARLFQHHSVLTQMENPWTSGWITWGLPRRPLVLGFQNLGGSVRALTSLGNLAIWWSVIALAAAALWAIALRGVTATLGPAPENEPENDTPLSLTPAAFVADNGRAVLIVLSGALSFLAPWVMTHRDSYIYHYLPTYACLVVLLGGYLTHVLRARPQAAAAFMLLILTVSLLYAPVWSFMRISPQAYEHRLFLESWR